MTIIALHGFLGLPADWSVLNINCRVIPRNLNLLDTHEGLREWAQELNSLAEGMSSPPILMGYSFGGRLALHALIQKPELWRAAIIISSHPGLELQNEKIARLQDDTLWAKRFLNDPWDLLMQEWNRRSVFSQGGFQFNRQEADFNRTHLSQLLVSGSLGTQENLRSSIEQLPMPLLWGIGQKDTKYRNIASQLNFSHPQSSVWEVPNAGHRLPWEQPELFSQKINHFVAALES